MSTLNLSDTEQRVEIFQSRLRTDYAAKIQEVAKLTDVVAKLQTQLLDVEHENNVLRQQLVISKKRIDDLEKGTGLASEKEIRSISAAGISTVHLNPSLKRERSPSLEILDVPQPPSKKAKRKQREQNSATSTDLNHRPTNSAKVQIKQIPAASESDLDKETDAETVSNSPKSSDSSSYIKVQPAPTWKEQLKNTTALALPKSLVNTYLREVHALKISPCPIDLKLSQAFLAMNYGGCRSTSLLLGKFTKNNPSGSNPRGRCFALLSKYPNMPSRPGEPGLLSLGLHQAFYPLSLFCSLSESYKNSDWLYLGEYECSVVGKMSAECFKMQSPTAKQRWARLIVRQRRIGAYCLIRARIALRLAFMIPMNEQKQEEDMIQQEVAMIKKKQGRPVSEDDVISAYSNGEEKVEIFRVHCVKYDHVFANDIKDRFLSDTSSGKNKEGEEEIENSDSGSNEEDDGGSDSDADTPPPTPKSTTIVSKKQTKSNVLALVKNLRGKKPNIQPVASASSDSESSGSDSE